MSANQPLNKRKFERVVIGSERIYDLSEGGVYVRTVEPKRLGATIGLALKLFENERPISARGTVIRIVYAKGAGGKLPPGMAVRFIEITEEDRERIRVFIAQKKIYTS